MAVMMTIKETVEELKRENPHQGVTEHALRQYYKSGQIRGLRIGKRGKILLNFDSVNELLNGSFHEKGI